MARLPVNSLCDCTSQYDRHIMQAKAQNRHTIVLMQPISNRATRTFMDFVSVSAAMDGICGLYEKKLKDLNPQLRNITYEIADLYKFVDSMTDLSALVFDPAMSAYIPYDRQWIKQRAYQHLKRLAGLVTSEA